MCLLVFKGDIKHRGSLFTMFNLDMLQPIGKGTLAQVPGRVDSRM